MSYALWDHRVEECLKLVQHVVSSHLETLPVDDGWARLIVLLLGDPHLLEGGQRCQDGSSNPDRVLPLWWGNDLDLHGGWGQGSNFLLHTVSNTRVHSGASRENSVGIQVLTDVNIALHDGVVGGLVDSAGFHSKEGRLEKSLWATEPLVTNGDDLSVRKLIRLLKRAWGSSSCHFLLKVKSNIAKFLLDISDNFSLSCGGETVTSLGENLHEMIGEITASQIKTKDSMRKSITWVI